MLDKASKQLGSLSCGLFAGDVQVRGRRPDLPQVIEVVLLLSKRVCPADAPMERDGVADPMLLKDPLQGQAATSCLGFCCVGLVRIEFHTTVLLNGLPSPLLTQSHR